MKHTIKRFIALLLALAISLSLMCANVWAAEEPEQSSVSSQNSESVPEEVTSAGERAVSSVKSEPSEAEDAPPQASKEDNISVSVSYPAQNNSTNIPDLVAQSYGSGFASVSLTGNQANDLCSVARAQIGKNGSQLNYSGYLDNAWCAAFVSDCAEKAGIPTSIIPHHTAVNGLYNALLGAGGKVVSTPQAGDIIIYYCNSCGGYKHTAIYGGNSTVIHGNWGNAVATKEIPNDMWDDHNHTAVSGVVKRIFVRPNYTNSSHIPVGCLDAVTGEVGAITVHGWAFDRDNLSAKLQIHVYVGGPAGSGAPGYPITANKSRSDVNNVYPGVGNNHGFHDTIQVSKTGEQTVYVYACNEGEGSNVLLGSKTVTIYSHNPEGRFDSVTGEVGAITVHGWAFDRDNLSAKLQIHVYVGGPNGPDVLAGAITADKNRPDVNTVYPGVGSNHGYHETIQVNKTGEQTIYVYACNEGEGGNVLLGSKTVTIYSHIPDGRFDYVTGEVGAITVHGWAFDRDNLSAKLQIHVYVGGPAGSGAPVYSITANKSRPDVNSAYPGVGENHGYHDTIQVSKTGEQTIYVYACNEGEGSNVLLGSKTTIIKDKGQTNPTPEPEKVQISSCVITLSQTSFTYNGTAKQPTVTVKDGNKTLTNGTDYEVSYKDNVAIGTATVTVTGKGGYIGSQDVTFVIVVPEPAPHEHTYGTPSWTWSSDHKKASATFICRDNDDTQTVDAFVSEETTPATTSADGKIVYAAKVSFNGNTYTDTRTVSIPKQPEPQPEPTPQPESEPSPEFTLSATKLSKVKVKKTTATVTWKKNTKGKGYQLQYSTNASFSSGVKTINIKKNKTVKATVKKLKKKSTYYFRIRTVNGSEYSEWSSTKSVKVK